MTATAAVAAITHTDATLPPDDEFGRAVEELRVGAGGASVSEQRLMVAGGVLAPLGLVVVLLGWFGAARTPHVFEQVPYLISGGLLGLGLAFIGGFLYFAHWITELVKETRRHSAAVVSVLEAIQADLQARPPAGSGDAVTAPPAALVATARGSMAHRPDCVVVTGKEGLRPVGVDDGYAACKLCDPYADDEA